MRTWNMCVIVACVLGIACGGQESGGGTVPTAPTPSPTPTSLSISGPTTLRTGQRGNYTAALTMSNGTTQNVTPSWMSDNVSVLAVNNSGEGRGAGHGSATMVASTQGLSASTLVRVYQDYQGTWRGTHRIKACDERGAFVGICKEGFPLRTVLPFEVRLTQNGGSATGSLLLGQVSFNITGAIFDSRHFVGAGSSTYSFDDVTFIERIDTLDLLSNGAAMSGSLVATIEALGYAGNTYLESDLSNVGRTSSTVRPVPRLSFSSVNDMLQAFGRDLN